MPLSPRFQFSRQRADVRLRRARLQAHEGVGEVVERFVVLRREVVGLGLALAAEQLGLFVALVHVVRDGPEVVEELAEKVPALLAFDDVLAEQQIAGLIDRVLEQEARAVGQPHVAQALVGRGAGTVVGIGGRRKPPFVDPAAMTAERIHIIRVQLEPASRHHEGAGNPARFQPEETAAGVERLLNLGAIEHQSSSRILDEGTGDDTFGRRGTSSAFRLAVPVSRNETTRRQPRSAVRDPETGRRAADGGLRPSPLQCLDADDVSWPSSRLD